LRLVGICRQEKMRLGEGDVDEVDEFVATAQMEISNFNQVLSIGRDFPVLYS
jgi:hypothetical protein